jgi:hypothetical protein
MTQPDDPIEAHEDLDVEQIAEDAGELFGAKDTSPPVAEADAEPPG